MFLCGLCLIFFNQKINNMKKSIQNFLQDEKVLSLSKDQNQKVTGGDIVIEEIIIGDEIFHG